MKKIFNKEFVIGVCVIVCIAVLIFGIDYLKGINLFQPANFYVASYSNVDGLDVAAPVKVDGYKVGQVREIRFNYEKPGKIDVVLALNKDLRLPDDSRAMLASTLMSGGYIDIKLGTSRNFLPVGGEVQTQGASDLMASLQNELMPKVNQILPRIDSLLWNLNNLVSDPALYQGIRRIDGITDNLLQTTVGLNGTINRDLPVIVRSAHGAIGNVDSVAVNLADLSRQLKALPLQPTMENIQTVTANLTAFSKQLNDPNSTLGALMNDSELYNRVNRVAADVDSLIIDIKKNPKRYISIKLL